MSKSKDKAIMLDEYYKGLRRALMRDGHELIEWYCSETKQYPKYQGMPWWNFARHIRNTVSHKLNGKLTKWPVDLRKKGIKRVEWKDRQLDESCRPPGITFLV